jgi:hypothetical protein
VIIRLAALAAAVAIIGAAPLAAEEFSQTPIGSLIVQDESGGENIPNFRYDAKHTAGGLCQMTNETWRRVAPTIDIDLEKFPNAGSASRFMQNQACWKLLAMDGVAPWTCCNKQLREHLAQHPPPVNERRASEKPERSVSARPATAQPHVWDVFPNEPDEQQPMASPDEDTAQPAPPSPGAVSLNEHQ